MTLWIDPPSGWKYGFPKAYTKPEDQSLEAWMLEQGYPQWEIDRGMLKHCRYGGTNEELDALTATKPKEEAMTNTSPQTLSRVKDRVQRVCYFIEGVGHVT